MNPYVNIALRIVVAILFALYVYVMFQWSTS